MPTISVSLALDRFTTFGDLLKYLRRRTGLTQRELSIAVGYSDTQISRLEQNERMPDLATLTARFLPALQIEDQPEVAARLLELASAVRREDAPTVGFPPYKGLHHYEESDAKLFFGRETLTEILYDRLIERLESDQRFLAVIGASGSGKSSVVRAGLIPSLHWQQPSSAWPVFLLTPTAHPLKASATSLNQETRQNLPIRKLVDELERNPGSLMETLQRRAHAASSSRAILIIDQFEELFTLCRSETEQFAFVDNLVTAAFQPGGVGMVVVVMRADFYAHCARFDRLRRAMAQYQEYIGPMLNEELRCVIEEPARCGHWEFEPGLVDLLLHDVGADAGHTPEPGALPLLSHALLATWQRRRGRTMTLSGYTASGGVRGAIAETAEAVFYDRLEPEQRQVARRIFLRMTELGGETSTADTRRRVSLAELVSKPENRDMVNEVLLILADARLITTDRETAEVAHEALIREWPTLRGWLEEDREGLRLHRRLAEAAQEWKALGCDLGVLHRGARLAQAVEWVQAHPDHVNLLELNFLEASQALLEKENIERDAQRQRELEVAQRLAETERQRAEAEQRHASEQARAARRLRQRAQYLTLAFGAVLVLLLAAVWLGQLANNNALAAQEQARLASSRELAAAAVNNLQVDPERSVLLALQALSTADTLEARNALHRALPELHILLTIPAHRQSSGVAYSPDGTRLASIGVDGEARIWDASSGQELLTLSVDPEMGWGIAYSPDGKRVATVWSSQLVVWDVESGQPVLTLRGDLAEGTINHAKFSPDGAWIAVANLDGMPRVWDAVSGEQIFALSGHEQICDAIAFSPDGTLLSSGDQAGNVKIWDAATGQVLFSFGNGGLIHDLAFSPDGHFLASANEDGTLKVWDPTSGQALLGLPRMSGLYGVTFMPDSRRLVTGHQDGTAKIWDASSGQLLLTLAGHVSTVVNVAGSPDGMHIATAGYDGTLRIWDATPGREEMTLAAHTDQAYDVSYNQDGTYLATVGMDGFARVWEAATGKLLRELDAAVPLTSMAYSLDDKLLAAGAADGSVHVWELDTGKLIMRADGHQAMVPGVAFSPDGNRLVNGSWDGTVKVWEVSSGREIVTFSAHSLGFGFGIAFSPDGKYVFSGGADSYARQWDSNTGQQIEEYYAEGREIYGLALSPNGSLLALGLHDGELNVWDTRQNAKILTLTGHAGLVARLSFSRDGTRLASASLDGYAKVWDIQSGEELFTLYGNTSNVFGVSFSPDGAYLATAGGDGTARIYMLRMEELVDLARSRATRTLSEAECRQYLHLDQCSAALP